MANFIYRGIEHDGIAITQPRFARDMIYRGVRHDGLSTQAPRIRQSIAMVYRGVRYLIGAGEMQADIGFPNEVKTAELPFGAARVG